jgi:hypothetical protein
VEGRAFHSLRDRLTREIGCGPERYWLETVIGVISAYDENDRLAREPNWQLSYAEYLANGEESIATAQFVATFAWAYGFEMQARLTEVPFRRFLHDLTRFTRLQNDLASVERERSDGGGANALLVMEPIVGAEAARAFVTRERNGYWRLLCRDIERLGPTDPFARLARVLVAATQSYYDSPRERYSVSQEQ